MSNYKIIEIPKTPIENINKQYQKINSISKDLITGVESNSYEGNIPQVFFGLMYLHSHHFTQEQITLAKYNFEGLYDLKAFHRSFLDDVLLYREKVAKNPKIFCTEMINFLNHWAKDYFIINQYAIDFLVSKGVK